MRNFLKHTEEIKEARAKHHVWTGCQDVPSLRRKAKAACLNRDQLVRLHAASAASRGMASAASHTKAASCGNWAGRRTPSRKRSPPAAASTHAKPAALDAPKQEAKGIGWRVLVKGVLAGAMLDFDRSGCRKYKTFNKF